MLAERLSNQALISRINEFLSNMLFFENLILASSRDILTLFPKLDADERQKLFSIVLLWFKDEKVNIAIEMRLCTSAVLSIFWCCDIMERFIF